MALNTERNDTGFNPYMAAFLVMTGMKLFKCVDAMLLSLLAQYDVVATFALLLSCLKSSKIPQQKYITPKKQITQPKLIPRPVDKLGGLFGFIQKNELGWR